MLYAYPATLDTHSAKPMPPLAFPKCGWPIGVVVVKKNAV